MESTMRSEWKVASVVDPDHYYSSFFTNKPTVLNSLPILTNYRGGGGEMFPIRRCGDLVLEQPPGMAVADRDCGGGGDDEHDESVKRVDVVDFFAERRCDDRSQSRDGCSLAVKRESSHGEAAAAPLRELDVNTGLNLVIANRGSDESEDGNSASDSKRAKIELSQLQMELERMTAENVKLKEMLTHVSNNYEALQLHMMSLMKQQQSSLQAENAPEPKNVDHEKPVEKKHGVNGLIEPRRFLEIGRSGSAAETDEVLSHSSSEDGTTQSGSPQAAGKRPRGDSKKDGPRGDKMVAVREDSPNSDTQVWTADKPGNNANPNTAKASIDQQSAEATMRKARVSVRARSEAPMISDGCQWRKYGQKMAKGNPCPRAYYRCTMAVGCPVRKQIQRCAEDRTILVTTYEGNHNHPLPPAAMSMASTTTAAAAMLLSGSMSSADGLMNPNFLARAMLPACSSSMATISASAPFPTVTLDLTHSGSPGPLQLQRPHPQAQFPGPIAPQMLTSLPFITNALPQIFTQALHNQSKFSGLQASQDDSINAVTAAIAADPSFTAAVAATISSIISGGGANHSNNNNNNNNGSSITSIQPQ